MRQLRNKRKNTNFLYQNLNVSSLNIQGGFTTKSKLTEFISILKKRHLFGLQETWLENLDNVFVPEYEIFRSERVKGRKAN